MAWDAVIRNAYCHPHGTLVLATLANHLHNPHFVWIAYGERLALAVVAILCNKVCHYFYSFTCGLGTFQSNVDEAAIVYQACRILTLMTSAPSRLGNSHLMLIDVSHNLVGVWNLWNLAPILACIPVDDFPHFSCLMVGSRYISQESEKCMGIGCIRNKRRTIGAGFLADNQISTCIGVATPPHHQCRCNKAYGTQKRKMMFHKYSI